MLHEYSQVIQWWTNLTKFCKIPPSHSLKIVFSKCQVAKLTIIKIQMKLFQINYLLTLSLLFWQSFQIWRFAIGVTWIVGSITIKKEVRSILLKFRTLHNQISCMIKFHHQFPLSKSSRVLFWLIMFLMEVYIISWTN